ncbi:DNA binding domain, excisionase family [Thermoanaerobacter pseudethanolicus ATCC 33223]|uniref:DNA binding domain, excisionase family n=1 Tax=Thermoanaerobacter pseudethanolicus (strain ATCC 33223 / 39E) TaxID=340099 RepID=B0KAZ3_THEP3|nr:DNA binding domain, excisionase family [Thermoanaerobacter pseudethanolicus ATCC 33223]
MIIVEEYFTVKEVSEKLKLNTMTIYKWIKQGKIRAIKLGDTWRISESELNRILNENKNV